MIRKAVSGDIKKINEIERENFSDAWSENMLADGLKNESAVTFVFESGGVVVSYISLLEACGDGELLRVATEQKSKRNGYAARLLDFSINYLKKRGIDSFFLEVRFDNFPAKKLYEKYGFQKISVRKKYYDGEFDAEIYKLILSNYKPVL
jgi:ribosomal-protein-alanine acetyltransferase